MKLRPIRGDIWGNADDETCADTALTLVCKLTTTENQMVVVEFES